MEWRVPLVDLEYGIEEQRAVEKVLKNRWLSMGAVTEEFESCFARLLGVKYAFAVSNGTVALHLACLALGIGAGDEVTVPSLTFVATSNAVLYTGARVRFGDISSPQDLNISPQEVEKSITPDTRAVIVMHYGGYPCNMPAILEIASRYQLAVIEDSAHAPGASIHGKMAGTWGDIGCFSFFSNKNLATGEGGMVVTDREDIAQKIRLLRSHGMDSLTWDRYKGHAYTYDVVALGYNYRLDEIRSALGLVQLQKLLKNNARRKTITEAYWRAFVDSELDLPFYDYERNTGNKPAFHIFPILLPAVTDRKTFMDSLRSAGVQSSIHYPPIHQFSYYRKVCPGVTLPQTEAVSQREVTLPLYPSMDEVATEIVINAVLKALSR